MISPLLNGRSEENVTRESLEKNCAFKKWLRQGSLLSSDFFFNGEKLILNKTFGLFSRFSLSYLSERKNLFRYLWNKYNTANKQCCVRFLSTPWYVSENPLICFVILLNSWIIIHVHFHAVISIALTSENFRKKYYCQLWWLPWQQPPQM